MGSEECLDQIVEVLYIIIDRRPKRRPRKREKQIIEKIGCPYFKKKKWGQ